MNIRLKIRVALRLFSDILGNFFTTKKLILVSEGFDWVIHEECLAIKKYLEQHSITSVRVSTSSIGLHNKVVHFLSENTLIGPNGLRYKKGSNHFILTWFHISEADTFRTKYIADLDSEVDFIHTASSITAEKLKKYGVKEDKIIKIGLDVNSDIFFPVSIDDKMALRKRLGLPTDKILIGSFQKDGNGWGDGLEPKLIKGPDIFCTTIERLAKKYPLHIILTGPARGYVKQQLSKLNIPYTHRYLDQYEMVAEYFRAIDLYLVCSREEGGPKAILESMASGIPIISTRVGMAPDVIEGGVDGFLASVEDVDSIVEYSERILDNSELRFSFIKNGLEKSRGYTTDTMVAAMHDKMYKKLLAD